MTKVMNKYQMLSRRKICRQSKFTHPLNIHLTELIWMLNFNSFILVVTLPQSLCQFFMTQLEVVIINLILLRNSYRVKIPEQTQHSISLISLQSKQFQIIHHLLNTIVNLLHLTVKRYPPLNLGLMLMDVVLLNSLLSTMFNL